MANLQVRDIDDKLYKHLKNVALLDKRSISQEVVLILENYLSSPKREYTNATLEFLTMAGSWRDDRKAEVIIKDIRSSRKNSNRFNF